ncbi:hypothetical protein PHAVU_011G201000 [Phaseolus vulgaris]
MALELVGGALLSAFLQVVFEKLASPQILDFFHARELDQKLLNKLEIKLHSIHSLADDAERKQFMDLHIRNWLLKVKDAILDAEDLLDDIQKLSKRQDAESESQSSGCTCKVLNFFKSSPITISSLNKEIECKMEQILDGLEFLSSQRGDLGLKTAGSVGSGLSNELPQKSQTTSLVVGADIYGRDDDKRLIIDWLTSDINNGNQPSILSVVGMGGVGKTTLAQHVFNDPKVDEAKFVVKAWVCVSDEFDVFKISKAIIEAVTKSTDDSKDLEMVHTRLKDELMGKKFLLVLDDVWNENQNKWEEVRKPLVLGAQGSKILVTTRSKEVASTMWSEEYSLQQLQEDDCWKLFAKHAFRDYDTQLNPECREIGMKIVKKCKGLPLALKTMGSMLYNKSSILEWKAVFQSEIWEFSKERCDIIPALALSYIHLPSHLKICYANCALFPKDYEFKKEDLILLWMTENFTHYGQHSRTPEEVCQQYFNDLLSSFLKLELPDSIGNLEYLRSLDLSHTAIKRLNEKICLLSHLLILKLNSCRCLEELPSNLHLLTNLCHLELMLTKVRKMPPYLGKMKNLKVVMSSFNVDDDIQQLRELNLEGSLSIKGLQNVENSLDALEADLKNKTHLVALTLQWQRNQNSIDSKKEEDVIENLQPSGNLKELSIFGYGGKRFPNWLLDNSLWNMVSLKLTGCQYCQLLPPLGLLPFLKVLEIRKLDGIVSIDGDFHGNNSSSFKSLETLEFSHMCQWEEWECQAVIGAFPCLRKLSITNCPKLKGQLPEKVVPLETLEIEDCQQLEASAPRALELKLRDCGKLQLEWGTMKSLTMTTSLLETVRSSDTLDNLEMISHNQIHNHLEEVTLKNCPKLESLPGSMHMLLPSLRKLSIRDCPGLKTFPDKGFPSELKDLTIINCSRLVGSLKGAFTDSPSLKTLRIHGVDAKCFPDEGLLPPSLTSLIIYDCPNLEKLDYKGLHQLSSLQKLNLNKCPNLQCLPEEGLPKSISTLHIGGCPLLLPRCVREEGEDWEKIVHITNLYIW